ncbi:MAG: hypothetical protein JO247_18810 [Chloroflexi bacterium]|nr:hypothetical protein [Chloroflexota bacterium]
MDSPAAAPRSPSARFFVLTALALVLVAGFGVLSKVTHTATIANTGLPPSNSKTLPGVNAYDPQVSITREYLNELVSLNYQAAYQLIAPSVRGSLSEADFEAARRKEGVLTPPNVWPDDQTTTRAAYVLGRPDGSQDNARHRFQLSYEQGRWWLDQEAPLPAAPGPAPSLTAALTSYVQQQAGQVWTKSVELLRQEGFEGGQLLLFSYIDPAPPTSASAERMAVLSWYVNGPAGWTFSGGGSAGLEAGMGIADVSMGFTAFGTDQQYTAYYGVVENTNAVTLTFQEPDGAGHTIPLKGETTIVLINDRNPFEALPFAAPFKSLAVKDVHGNSMRTNPTVAQPA